MLVSCPFCGYRIERDVTVNQEIPCPRCGRPHQPLPGSGAEGQPPVSAPRPPPESSCAWEWKLVFTTGPARPARTQGSAKGGLLLLLLGLGLILFLPAWSAWQNARDRANSPPGLVLSAQGVVVKVVFRPDGQRLASGGGTYKGRGKWVTGEIRVWDPATGQCVLAFPGHPEGVMGLDYSPDGQRLASASADGVKVWDAATGKQLLTLRMQPKEEARRVVFDPQGNQLATLSWRGHLAGGRGPMAVRVWSAPPTAEGEQKWPLFSYYFEAGWYNQTSWNLPGLAFSPDGTRLACGRDDTVLIWDFSPGRPGDDTAPALVLKGHTRPVCDQAFSPDGKRLATSSYDETIRIWDVATGRELLSFESPRHGVSGYRGIDCLAFSPDGKRLAGGRAQNLVIWDAATGKELHYLRWHSQSIASVAFSPDGKTLATGADDHEIKLWDLVALEHWTGAGQGKK